MSSRTFRLAAMLVAVWITFSRLYVLLRYQTHWTEWDTGYLSMTLKRSLSSGSLTPDYFQYTNGAGYQAFSIPAIYFSGLSVFQYQIILSPFLALVPFPILYVVFRKALGKEWSALLGIVVVSLLPYFAVQTVRGTHDKFTYALIAMIFVAFLEFGSATRKTVPYVACAIMAFWALGLFNVFVGTALSASLVIALAASRIFRGTAKNGVKIFGHQVSNAIMGFVAVSSVVFWLYPPALSSLLYARSVGDGFATFLLGGPRTSNYLVYNYLSFAYSSLVIYALLSSFTWISIILSIVGWCIAVRTYRSTGVAKVPWLWLMMFASLATIFVAALAIDLVTGNDFQLRAFGLLVIFIPPLAVLAIERSLHHAGPRKRLNRVVTGCVAALLLVGIPTCLLQYTNDPAISNNWFFYTPSEGAGLSWLDVNQVVGNVSVGGSRFQGGNRLVSAYYTISQRSNGAGPLFVSFDEAQYYVLSGASREIFGITHQALPKSLQLDSILYTNGDTVVYMKS